MVEHTFNSSTGKLRQEDHEFEAGLGYVARSCLKRKTNKAKKT
jgi:hypothetical protein